MKKIASTLLRFGPPLAGEPSVFFGVFEMMFESVRMNVSHMPGLVAEPLDDRQRVADRLVLRLAVARVGPREHALAPGAPRPRPGRALIAPGAGPTAWACSGVAARAPSATGCATASQAHAAMPNDKRQCQATCHLYVLSPSAVLAALSAPASFSILLRGRSRRAPAAPPCTSASRGPSPRRAPPA